jgi:PHP family Zn ribbon phosphoesterase
MKTTCNRCRMIFRLEEWPRAERLQCPDCKRKFWSTSGTTSTYGKTIGVPIKVGMDKIQVEAWSIRQAQDEG